MVGCMKRVSISYLNYLRNLPHNALVRLYSYQGREAWMQALKTGHWSGTDGRYIDANLPPQFGLAYNWMRDQMKLNLPQFSGDYPMWGWVRRPSTKPGLYPLEKGSDFIGVRLTVMVPRCRILFSNYETWHCVLNRSGIYDTEAQFDIAERATKEEVEATWPKCLSFDKNKTPEELYWKGSSNWFQAQACVDRFYWDDIVQVRHFVANKYKRKER